MSEEKICKIGCWLVFDSHRLKHFISLDSSKDILESLSFHSLPLPDSNEMKEKFRWWLRVSKFDLLFAKNKSAFHFVPSFLRSFSSSRSGRKTEKQLSMHKGRLWAKNQHGCAGVHFYVINCKHRELKQNAKFFFSRSTSAHLELISRGRAGF